MLPYAIYGFVVTFNLFHLAYFMSAGGPFGRTEQLVTQAFRLVNEQRLYGVAAAFSVFMFFILLAHGLLQPSSQMGAIGPFPREAGAAAALGGFLMYLVGVVLGIVLGASFDGTMRPLATAVMLCTCTTLAGSLLIPGIQIGRAHV